MNWKNVLFSSACTGALAAVFIIIAFVLAEINPGSFAGVCGSFFTLATISAAVVNRISRNVGCIDVPLNILIPVGFLTTIMPLFGATFGMPNSNVISLVTLVALGAVGGIFWSTPFILWQFFSTDSDLILNSQEIEATNQTIIQNVTYNINDSVVTGNLSSMENQDEINE